MIKRKILIDTDPGVDDSFAILLAQTIEHFDICAVTVTAGNVGLKHTVRNGLGLLETMGLDVPVYGGASSPMLIKLREADDVHGNNGLGGYEFSGISKKAETMLAWDAIYEFACKYDGDLEILSLGPPTNIAIALSKYPTLASKIKKIVLMGGSIETGNTEPLSEFNFWCDPHATQIVLESGIDMDMVGLNATRTGFVPMEVMRSLVSKNEKINTLIQYLNEFYKGALKRFGYGDNLHIPDAVAAFAMAYPEHVVWQPMHVTCICDGGHLQGWTKVETRGKRANMMVAISCDKDRFIEAMKKIW